jgi:outer membrane protein W
MKLLRIFSFTLLAIFTVSAASAQQGITKAYVGYSVNIPSGSFKDAVSDASLRGVELGILHGVTDKIAVGFGTGFQDFYQKYPRQIYKTDDGSDISAVVSNSVQTIPLLAKFRYYFSPEKRIQPFAGAGVGGNMVLYRQFLGEFADSKNKFAFQAQPEIGLYMPFKPGSDYGFSLRATYNYIPFKYGDVTDLNSFGVSASFNLPLRN